MPLPVMQMPKVEDDTVVFTGGLDYTTPNTKLAPGHVRQAENWQCVSNQEGGGYERTGGYERFTGGTGPTALSSSYSVVFISAWIRKPSTLGPTDSDVAGLKFIGSTSGVQLLMTVSSYQSPSPKIGGGLFRPQREASVEDATDPLWEGQAYWILPGTPSFVPGETLSVRSFDVAGNESLPVDIGIVASMGNQDGPLSDRTRAIIAATRADGSRANMATVPGSGPILGVCSLVTAGVRTVYAWRNTTAGTAAAIYKSSSVGWTAVALQYEIRFTAGGTTQPAEGATLTKGAVTATIKRVVQESGDWATNTAAGRVILLAPSGGSFTAGAATVGAITLTLSGAETAITLLPNGKYQFEVTNFRGQLASKRIYGADGVNRAFEFDGDILVPIETKAITDTPKFVRDHQGHLVVAIGSSLMLSGPGTPYKFTATAGGLELATSDEITGMLVQAGDQTTAAMAVFGRNSSGMLYGTSIANFNYKKFATMTGALPYMQANLDQSYVWDDRGVMTLAAGQEYGNFKQATLTANIADYLTARKAKGVMSCVSTDRSQFRLFFSDGSALYLTIVNGRMIGAMPQLFRTAFSCVWNGEDASGLEETFAGGTDGYLYQLDIGTSFDGAPISHSLVLAQNFMKAPTISKQFRNGHIEIDAERYVEFFVGYAVRYGSGKVFQPIQVDVNNALRLVPAWDTFVWDQFIWDGIAKGPIEISVKGKGEAIQMAFTGSSDVVPSFRISSMTTYFTYARRTRCTY